MRQSECLHIPHSYYIISFFYTKIIIFQDDGVITGRNFTPTILQGNRNPIAVAPIIFTQCFHQIGKIRQF